MKPLIMAALAAGGLYLFSRANAQGAPAAAGSGGGAGVPDSGGGGGGVMDLSGIMAAIKSAVAPSSVTNASATPTPNRVNYDGTVHDNSAVHAAANTAVTVEDLYSGILHRAPDAAGLAYWQNAFGGDTVNLAQEQQFFKAAIPELQAQAQ